MSIKIMTAVWEHYEGSPAEVLLALALADHAHDDGTRIYPSVESLARKTRQSEPTVKRGLRRMRENGWLVSVAYETGGRGKSREYRISAAWIKGVTMTPFSKGDHLEQKRGSPETERGSPRSEKGITAVTPQPSYNHQEPSENHQEAQAPLFDTVPDWIPMEAWTGFVEMRKKIRKPMTPYSVQLIVRELDKFRLDGDDIVAVLNKSIRNDWQDVYSLKSKSRQGPVSTAYADPNRGAILQALEDSAK